MLTLILKETDVVAGFYPLTLTRHFIDLKVGIFTIREKWELLAQKQGFQINIQTDSNQVQIARVSFKANLIPPPNLDLKKFFSEDGTQDTVEFKKIENLWDLVDLNHHFINADLDLLNNKNSSVDVPNHVKKYGTGDIYLGLNSILENCSINTVDGPVYIDDNVTVMDGAMLRGPLYIGENSIIKMGATIYGGTTIGPNCVIGGEVKNSIFHANSNKAHHGYIGNSYIGEWCNLGAGTSCSNLKNTIGRIKVWEMSNHAFKLAGTKAGIYMGDHVRSAINTSFNSGTVIGTCANVFEFSHLSNKFIPSFSWGGNSSKQYELEKLFIEIDKWMELKGQKLNDLQKEKISTLYFKSK